MLIGERIHMADANPRVVLFVPGDDHQVPFQGRGCNQTIDDGDWIRNAKSAPSFGNALVEADDTITKLARGSRKPVLEHRGGSRILPSHLFYASAQLTQREDTQEEFLSPALAKPADNALISSITFAEFRYDVRVQEIAHSSMSRGGDESRSKSASSPTSGMARRCSTNESGGVPSTGSSPSRWRSASCFASAASRAFERAESTVSSNGSAHALRRRTVVSETRITGMAHP